ncbi:MAG: tetraacyldisaccharide 4'-kinase [Nitrospirota bacterium]
MTVIEFLYYLGYLFKKSRALRKQKKLPCRVISIGNITLGGTGKSPATIALAREAMERGFRPCILTRGYKGSVKGPTFVSKGKGPLLTLRQAGDEASLLSEKLRDVPIVKGGDRYEAGMFALRFLESTHSPDLFILDDGFQHWGLYRNKNVLLIDSTNPFGNRKLFPLGILREPIGGIKRADIIVLTRVANIEHSDSLNQRLGDNSSLLSSGGLLPGRRICEGILKQGSDVIELLDEISRYTIKTPVFFAEHRPSSLRLTTEETLPLEWAKNKRFFGFCGIGNNESFRKTLLSLDLELTGFRAFRDHHAYRQNDIREILKLAKKSKAEWIVTTEKDIMRLKDFNMPENLVSLVIEFYIDKKFFEEVFRPE